MKIIVFKFESDNDYEDFIKEGLRHRTINYGTAGRHSSLVINHYDAPVNIMVQDSKKFVYTPKNINHENVTHP